VPTGYADIVVGGQAGSEGKGAIVAHLARNNDYAAAVRPGSSNAGHTVYDDDGESYVHQVIPSAMTVDDQMNCYMAPESSFALGELFGELQDACDRWGERRAVSRLHIDPKAAIITDEHRHTEADKKLGEDIGSTVHGCGAVRVDKIWRSAGGLRLAEDYACLEPLGARSHRVPDLLAGHGSDGEAVLIEGTQGAFLSMNQSDWWPFTTSRDCTASAFLSSCGLPPSAARDVWSVFRTYPIRVGGNSGDMHGDEIDFRTIAERAGHDEPPVEFTSVTNKKRRIFEWSWEEFARSIALNDPDWVALTFLDYLDADNYGATEWKELTPETREWINEVDATASHLNGSRVGLVKTGPKAEHIIDVLYQHEVPALKGGDADPEPNADSAATGDDD
jgi:adenylosuccinate synthase